MVLNCCVLLETFQFNVSLETINLNRSLIYFSVYTDTANIYKHFEN